jgi:hypothetical protein
LAINISNRHLLSSVNLDGDILSIENPVAFKICSKFSPVLMAGPMLVFLPFSAIGKLLKFLQISYRYLCSNRFGWENIL